MHRLDTNRRWRQRLGVVALVAVGQEALMDMFTVYHELAALALVLLVLLSVAMVLNADERHKLPSGGGARFFDALLSQNVIPTTYLSVLSPLTISNVITTSLIIWYYRVVRTDA